jgi:SPP1 gp7 family putative phage head morphogenesis protein
MNKSFENNIINDKLYFHKNITYRLILLDEIVAKTLKLSEMAQMSRIEQLLPLDLEWYWNNRRKQAALRAKIMVLSNSKPDKIVNAIRRIMLKWYNDIEKRFNIDIVKIYNLARKAGTKKANGEIKTSLAYNKPKRIKKAKGKTTFDNKIISFLKKSSSILLKRLYDSVITKTKAIENVVKEILSILGKTKKDIANLLMKAVKNALTNFSIPGFSGTSSQYFENLTTNVITTARAYGQLQSFEEAGITEYRISNPMDEKTCEVCAHMNGKTFSVQTGIEQLKLELTSKTPEDLKQIHPWVTPQQLKNISSVAGAIKGPGNIIDSLSLASAGLSLPTYHSKCRCVVDII